MQFWSVFGLSGAILIGFRAFRKYWRKKIKREKYPAPESMFIFETHNALTQFGGSSYLAKVVITFSMLLTILDWVTRCNMIFAGPSHHDLSNGAKVIKISHLNAKLHDFESVHIGD